VIATNIPACCALPCVSSCACLRLRQGWLNIDFAREVRLERKLGEGGFGQVRARVYDYACCSSGSSCSWRIIVCLGKLKQIEYQYVLMLAANMLCSDAWDCISSKHLTDCLLSVQNMP
jgi:hypothetical protein